MEKKSIYNADVYTEILDRINKLNSDSAPQWGKMTSAQMMAHCAEVMEVSNGKPLQNTPFIARLLKGYIKKMVVGPKPYPKNSKTHPQYLQTTDIDFDQGKQRLLNALNNMKEKEGEKINHTLFGVLTPEEKGWSQYKHLDHHLTQFGV
ncbi:MAG: hypothetical protein DHS20C17_27320 [Cyclobacteriaceae bacterium]|nr:MAG: hypothetical protein DHS20C17_27320 [Cyclobacteriaceae bacterium]